MPLIDRKWCFQPGARPKWVGEGVTKTWWTTLLLSGIAQLANAAAESPAVLAGDGPWQVRVVDNRCEMSRSFGQRAATLAVDRTPTTDSFTIALAMRALPRDVPSGFRDTLVATERSVVAAAKGRSNVSPSEAAYLLTIPNIHRRSLPELGHGQYLDLTVSRARVARLATDGIGPALLNLSQCEDVLAERWGLNVDATRAVVNWPQPLDGQTFFPDLSFVKGRSISIVLRYRVTAAGRARDCVAVQSSQEPAIDRAFCEAKVATRYRPATDIAGRPIDAVVAYPSSYRPR